MLWVKEYVGLPIRVWDLIKGMLKQQHQNYLLAIKKDIFEKYTGNVIGNALQQGGSSEEKSKQYNPRGSNQRGSSTWRWGCTWG